MEEIFRSPPTLGETKSLADRARPLAVMDARDYDLIVARDFLGLPFASPYPNVEHTRSERAIGHRYMQADHFASKRFLKT